MNIIILDDYQDAVRKLRCAALLEPYNAKVFTNTVKGIGQLSVRLRDADVLVDVREADEYAAGHIAGAVLVPRGLLEFKFSSTPALQPRDLKIVLYCKTSGRAALCGAALHEMGYLNVRSIAGGIDGWVAAGKPVVKPEAPSFE